MTTQKRAAKGGEIGANGERYEGGKFIATTDRAKGKAQAFRGGRVKIGPAEWADAIEGKASIYGRFFGFARVGYGPGAPAKLTASDHTIAFYGRDRATLEAQVADYNRGERWENA
jgi:hypothetical protein